MSIFRTILAFDYQAEENSALGEVAAVGASIIAVANPIKKLSKVTKSTKTEKIGDKFTKTTKVIPGNGPGQSRAEMEFVKNAEGKLIRARKFSYDRANKLQHKKRVRGGPDGRGANDDF